MPDKIITALFDSRNDAEDAVRRLSHAGIPEQRVQIASERGGDQSSLGTTGDLASVLNDPSLPASDRETFAEGLRRGGYLLTVRADDLAAPEVVSILDETDAVDLDDRAGQWRSSGWAGPQIAETAQTQTQTQTRTEGLTARATGDTSQRLETTQSLDQGQSIPVIEEELKVGKRQVQRGGVRVRSFVVETPVHEQVTLREEHVSVERRPVNQPVRAARDAAGAHVEFTETAEEAVVAKEARVVEEVVLRKDVEERVETIDETLRHTDVEIQDSRGQPQR
jgi:uncharacterized protein (TIGR02271 family)